MKRPNGDGPEPRVASRSDAEERVSGAAGTLVLIGGACRPRGAALGAFLDRSGARDGAPIVALTTASGTPREAARLWQADLAAAGAANVHIPLFDRRESPHDREIAAMVAAAHGVFLGGGDQVKLVSALGGSCTLRAIRDLHNRGGVVCGTSAGAAALTQLTMAGGEIDEEGKLVAEYLGPGLGLLGFGTIVDTHFSQRRRLQRLFVVIARNPELFGLGIDEDTALVVERGIAEVCGAGGVTFVDGRETVRYDNAEDVEQGRQLTLSHLRVGIVGTGHRLDLRARELEAVLGAPSKSARSS